MTATAASSKQSLVVCLKPTPEALARLRENGNRIAVIVPAGEPVERLIPHCEAIFTVDVGGDDFTAFLRDVVSTLRPRAVVAVGSELDEHAERAARLLGVPFLAGAGRAGARARERRG